MWDNVVIRGSTRRCTINEAFPSSLVMGEYELSNVFQTFVMFVRVQALKDRLGAICKNVRPCVKARVSRGHSEQNGERNFLGQNGICNSWPCIEHCKI